MLHIPIQVNDGVSHPSVPFPQDAIAIVCDGKKYIAYQPGDEPPPPQVTNESTEPA